MFHGLVGLVVASATVERGSRFDSQTSCLFFEQSVIMFFHQEFWKFNMNFGQWVFPGAD